MDPYKTINQLLGGAPLIGVTGFPKAGKSVYAASILSRVPPSEVAFLEIEDGAWAACASEPAATAWLKTRGVPEFPHNRVYDCSTFGRFTTTLEEQFMAPARKGKRPCSVLVFDSATELGNIAANAFGAMNEGSTDEKRSQIQAWGRCKVFWWKLLHQLREVGYTVVMTVHHKDMTDIAAVSTANDPIAAAAKAQPNEEDTLIVPDIMGAGGRREFERQVKLLINVMRKHGKVITYTETQNRVWAVRRVGVPSRMEDVSLGEVMEMAGWL